MIVFDCDCGNELKARDGLAGRKTRCPACAAVLRIPAAPIEVAHASLPTLEPDDGGDSDDSPYAIGDRPSRWPAAVAEGRSLTPSSYHPAPQGGKRTRFAERPGAARPAAVTTSTTKRRAKARPAAIKTLGGESSPREYSYVLLFLALIPLMFSLLRKDDPRDLEERIAATLADAAPEERQRAERVLSAESVDTDELIAAMPGGKLAGAQLPRTTAAHWMYATIAAVAYLSLLYFCFSVERTNLGYLFGIGAFTATVGIAFLLFVQFCSYIRFGRIRLGGIGFVIFMVLAFIGWSYNSANDPDSGLLLSAIGFTFGVGLCEEFTKAMPMFFAFRRQCEFGWRTACLWGLASGIGFGVAEGIMYSARHYNGIAGVEIYLVRFVSCVALHAMWSASVGIAIARNLDDYEAVDDAAGFGLFMLRVMAVPMTLHGCYDTLLKKGMNGLALLVAVLSFAWLAWHIEVARGTQPHVGRPKVARKPAF